MKSRILMAIAIAIAIAIALGNGIPASAKPVSISIRAIIDCEDVNTLTVPCVTYDEGAWRMVTDYSPYKSRVLNRCKTFTVKRLPCVNTSKMKNNRYWVGTKR